MWLLTKLRISHWVKHALDNHTIGNLLPCTYTLVVHLHQGIIPDTLLYRFFKFLGTCPKYKNFAVHSGNLEVLRDKFVIKYALLSESEEHCFKVSDGHQLVQKLKKIPLSELLQLIAFLSEANVLKNSNHYKTFLEALDQVCCDKIPSLPVEEAVRVNYCWLGLVGPRVKLLKSFNLLMNRYIIHVKESIQTPIVILMLFYSAIARKLPKAKEVVSIGVNRICNDKRQIHDLSDSEMILVSEVAFKTGLKIVNPIFIEHLVHIVSKDIPKFAMDPAQFVVVVKALRHNKYHDRNLLRSIHECLVEDNHILDTYNLAGITHLIALYADALYSDLHFMNYLIASAITSVSEKDSYNPFSEKGRGRAKDLARLLWATSYLGFKIDEDIMEKVIMPILMEKIENGVYVKQLSVLIDTVLSLWVMGFKPVNLLPHVFTKEMKKFLYETNRVRYKARLQLVSTCISIESPEAMNIVDLENFHLGDAYNPGEEKILKQRPVLREVVQDLRNAPFMPDSVDIICENSLPYLNIPGILLSTQGDQKRHSINIEVLDCSNCLHETNIPNGLMLLKLRLLRKLGHRIILVNYSDYENQKPEIMFQLEDEIMNIQEI